MKNIKTILPYLLITVFCVGGVEYFYAYLQQELLRPPLESETAQVASLQEKGEVATTEKRFDYQVIIDRNLFGGSLTAGEEKKDEVGSLDDLETTLLDIILLGTITGTSAERRAFILDKSTNSQEIYQKGDAIQGAIIKEILRGKVVLNFRGKDEILHMTTEKDGKSKGVAVTPSPRKRRAVLTPRAAGSGTSQKSKMRTVRPTRKFSFKNTKKPEPTK